LLDSLLQEIFRSEVRGGAARGGFEEVQPLRAAG